MARATKTSKTELLWLNRCSCHKRFLWRYFILTVKMPREVKTHLNSTQPGHSLFSFAIQRRTLKESRNYFPRLLFNASNNIAPLGDWTDWGPRFWALYIICLNEHGLGKLCLCQVWEAQSKRVCQYVGTSWWPLNQDNSTDWKLDRASKAESECCRWLLEKEEDEGESWSTMEYICLWMSWKDWHPDVLNTQLM